MNPYYMHGYNRVFKTAGLKDFVTRGAKRVGDALNVKGLEEGASALKAEQKAAINSGRMGKLKKIQSKATRDVDHWGQKKLVQDADNTRASAAAAKKLKARTPDDIALDDQFEAGANKLKAENAAPTPRAPEGPTLTERNLDQAQDKADRAGKAIDARTTRKGAPFDGKITDMTGRIEDAQKLRGQAATGAKVVGGVGVAGAGIAGANHLYENRKRSTLDKVRDTLGI